MGIFLWVAYVGLDPDFGWHLRLGDMMRATGFSDTDPFSYTMPSYPHIDHEWLTHIIWSFFYEWGGKGLLAVLYTVLALGSLVVIVPRKLYVYAVIPWIFTTGAMLSRFGVRPQVVGWFLLAVTIRILLESKKFPKLKWTLPFVFALWVNLHASFVFGIVLVGIYFLGNSVENRQVDKLAATLVAVCFFATMMNPYGIRMWQEVLGQAGSLELKQHILEWKWIFENVEFAFWGLSVLSGVMIYRYWKHLPKWLSLGQLVFFGFAVHAARQSPLSALFSIGICVQGLVWFWEEISKQKSAQGRTRKFLTVFLPMVLVVSTLDLVPAVFGWYNLREEAYYPTEVIQFLKTQQISGQIFADYSWGGYLVWKYPEKKVFITGQMPAYSWDAPQGESDSAFIEYLDIVRGVSLGEATDKYNIDYLLLRTPKSLYRSNNLIYTALRNIAVLKDDSNQLQQKIKSLGWNVLYNDKNATLYKR